MLPSIYQHLLSINANGKSSQQQEEISQEVNHLMTKAMLKLIINEARAKLASEYKNNKHLQPLTTDVDEWKQCHYRTFATLIDVSVSTAKRLVKGEIVANKKTQEKIALFLGKPTWAEVLNDAVDYISKILEEAQNKQEQIP